MSRRAASVCVALLLVVGTAIPLSQLGQISAANAPQVCASYQGNPVLNNSGEYITPFMGANLVSFTNEFDYASVLKVSGEYHLWFSGLVNNRSGIYAATSPDGVNWVVSQSPAITEGPNGTWDSAAIYSPSVVWNGSAYLMYYTGTGTNAFREIGLAVSKDGLSWQKYGQSPVLKYGPGFYDSYWTRYPDVIFDGGLYKMWYEGHTLLNTSAPWYVSIDLATSPDGIHWTKYPGNPVFGGGPNWASFPFIEHPSIAKINDTYIMAGDDGVRISYATSNDGVHWTSDNQTLVGPTSSPAGNSSALYPTLLVDGGHIAVWYTGASSSVHQQDYVGIDVAYCGFLALQTTTTTTATATLTVSSLSLYFSTTTRSITSVSTRNVTITIQSPNTGYQATVELAAGTVIVALGVVAVALYILRRPRG